MKDDDYTGTDVDVLGGAELPPESELQVRVSSGREGAGGGAHGAARG